MNLYVLLEGDLKMEFNELRVADLLHGADYNPEQWLDRPDILAKDIELMKEAHCNVVSMGCSPGRCLNRKKEFMSLNG